MDTLETSIRFFQEVLIISCTPLQELDMLVLVVGFLEMVIARENETSLTTIASLL